MTNLLYYPYINLPRTDWTLRTLLYYDNIGSIVPQDYFFNPESKFDTFMLELVRNQLVTPINPIDVLDNPWKIIEPFIELIESKQDKLLKSQNSFRKGKHTNIHSDKFDQNIFYALGELGLAKQNENGWYTVERKTADNLMSYLASVICTKTNRLPVTDYIRPTFSKQSFSLEQRKRETVLTELIPFPEEIDLKRLLKFKEKYSELLKAFRTRIERIVLDPNIVEGKPLFYNHLEELHQRKEELSAKMNESRFGSIMYGTVCGLIGAYHGITSPVTTPEIIGSIASFVNAVHSALQIEKSENVFDQSGLKYLALADKKLRRK